MARLVLSGVGHDAVVGAAGAGAAGAGAVAGEHLGGGLAVEFHQVAFGSAAVEPGVAEVVTEPVRVGGHAGLAAAAGDHLVDTGSGNLTEAGYVVKHKDGRRNRCQIQAHLPLPWTDSRERAIGEILVLLAGADDEATG